MTRAEVLKLRNDIERGFGLDHDSPSTHDNDGSCLTCPIQVQLDIQAEALTAIDGALALLSRCAPWLKSIRNRTLSCISDHPVYIGAIQVEELDALLAELEG